MSDYCFIIAPQNLHWVLDRIAHEVGQGLQGSVEYCSDLKNIPDSKHYFITHYSLLPMVLMKANPATSKITVFFTHESVPVSPMVEMLNICHSIICENPTEFERLISYGINKDILHFVVECADNNMFRPHSRTGKGSILISSACYNRKNPALLLDVMRKVSDHSFILVGKDWPEEELPEHVKYYENIPYAAYPEIYSKCDVFLCCAALEGGGPGGLIEAMHSNIVPVMSDTGNARQYITDTYNGFIFPTNSDAKHIAELIRKAYLINPQDRLPYNDIWQTVRQYTWDNYRIQMREILTDDYSLTTSQELPFEDSSD